MNEYFFSKKKKLTYQTL